jgi:D-tyrosyl-tRNA(Tyr) deacylase
VIALLQRVSSASVQVGGECVGAIGPGLLILLGVARGDERKTAVELANRAADYRLFAGGGKGMNRSVREVGGAVLVVSQFTLCADTSKGRRPSFDPAAPPAEAEPLYELFVATLRGLGLVVATGRFGAMMAVQSCNDGPVSLLLTR